MTQGKNTSGPIGQASDLTPFTLKKGHTMTFSSPGAGKTVSASTYEAMKLTSAELARICGDGQAGEAR